MARIKKPSGLARPAKLPIDDKIRLGHVVALAERIFGDKEKAHRWMQKPKLELGGATPFDSLASDAGARQVEEMLYRIDFGFLA